MDRKRYLLSLLALVWLFPLSTLFQHSSQDGVIFQRFTPEYFLLLIIYSVVTIAILLGFLFPIRLPEGVLQMARWVRARSYASIIMILLVVEIWYALRRVFLKTRFWGAKYDRDFQVILTWIFLLETYGLCILQVVGSSGEELRIHLKKMLGIISGTLLVFVGFSYLFAYVIRPEYVGYHRLWWEMHRPDPQFGYSLRPNRRHFEYPFPGINGDTVYVTTDTNGFRNQHPNGNAPIALLGDSMIFGLGVSDDQVGSVRLSQELNLSVSNYGVSGYSLWQYNRVAERYLAGVYPQLVIYNIYGDDLSAVGDSDETIKLLQNFMLLPYRSPMDYTVKYALSKSPLEWLVIFSQSIGSSSSPKEMPSSPLPSGLNPTCVLRALGGVDNSAVQQRLDRAIDLMNESGYKLLVVTIPGRESTYYDELMPVCPPGSKEVIDRERQGYEMVCNYLTEHNIPCYNMTEDMRREAHQIDRLLYGASDDHFSVLGHEVYARLLADYLRNSGLIDDMIR